MRFIFRLCGSALYMHNMLPYLKSFHLLPVKFRIEFKIALLTLKNLHGYGSALYCGSAWYMHNMLTIFEKLSFITS